MVWKIISHCFSAGMCPSAAYIYLVQVTDQRLYDKSQTYKASQVKKLHPALLKSPM